MHYLTKQMRINEAIEFLEPFASEDPTLVSLICDSILSVDKTKESIMLLAQKIKEYPMLVNLLLKQANSFI
jgi:F0F1-type ATP synthase delta subunit